MTAAQFARAFNSGEYVGSTFVVRGRIEAAPDLFGSSIPDGSLCDGYDACPYGVLANATTNGGTRPLIVWSHAIARPLHSDEAWDDYFWPKERTPLPVEGELVLRIDTGYSVEYIGRALVDGAGDVWGPASAIEIDKPGLELDQLLLVDGWLGQGALEFACPDEDHGPLPRHSCGHESWIATTAAAEVRDEFVHVQPDAYSQFAPDPRQYAPSEPFLPRHGIMALAPRLERDGCGSPPCSSWTVLGWLSPNVEPSSLVAAPVPSAVPEDEWIELAVEDGHSAEWSPDGRWLLISLFREVVLVDARTGDAVRHWDFSAGHYGRGAVWIDNRRFLAFNEPLVVQDGLAPAAMGRIDRAKLVSVKVPVSSDETSHWIDLVGGGNGAIAFNTTRVGEGGCGPDGCFTFRVWTPDGTSAEHAGMPIAWSPAGDRLAVIHNDADPHERGLGAGFGGYSGWLEVVTWPGLHTLCCDHHVVVHQDSAFDPDGNRLASIMGPVRIVDVDAGDFTDLDAKDVKAAWWVPVWDSEGDIVATSLDGDMILASNDGDRVLRWEGVGQRVVGTQDGRVQIAMLDDSIRAGPLPRFTLIRAGAATQFALPDQGPDAIFWDQAISPDGRAFYIWVRHYSDSTGQLLFRRLD